MVLEVCVPTRTVIRMLVPPTPAGTVHSTRECAVVMASAVHTSTCEEMSALLVKKLEPVSVITAPPLKRTKERKKGSERASERGRKGRTRK